jgi:putative pyruvate formate lyase activating enzyme
MNEILSSLCKIQSDTTLKNYLITKAIPVNIDDKLENFNFKELWKSHKSCRKEFIKIREAEKTPSEIKSPSYLDLKINITQEILKGCIFCEQRCGANRLEGEKGYCLVPAAAYVSSAFLHHGEEHPLVPSGTIFFSGCNFKCVFCQNDDISTSATREQLISPNDLATMAKRLYHNGAKNINYVGGDPTPHLHPILQSMNLQHHNTSQLWNSNF